MPSLALGNLFHFQTNYCYIQCKIAKENGETHLIVVVLFTSKEECIDINETTPYFFNRNGKQKVIAKWRYWIDHRWLVAVSGVSRIFFQCEPTRQNIEKSYKLQLARGSCRFSSAFLLFVESRSLPFLLNRQFQHCSIIEPWIFSSKCPWQEIIRPMSAPKKWNTMS